MRRIVVLTISVMLWVTALPTLAAPQQSIPNYVGQAPADVHKYYPQYEAYFKTIFDKINTLKPHSIALLNEEIHENMELFEEDIKSEKDKRTIILMALEMLIVGKKEFTKAKDVMGVQGDNDYKYEIAESIEDGATRKAKWEREQSQKELEQSQKRYDRIIARSGADANIILGITVDENMADEVSVTVIATGLCEPAATPAAAPRTVSSMGMQYASQARPATAPSTDLHNMRTTAAPAGQSGVTNTPPVVNRPVTSAPTTQSPLHKAVTPSPAESTVTELNIKMPDFMSSIKK